MIIARIFFCRRELVYRLRGGQRKLESIYTWSMDQLHEGAPHLPAKLCIGYHLLLRHLKPGARGEGAGA